MLYIDKVGVSSTGSRWVLFHYEKDNIVINGIANTKLDNLKPMTKTDTLHLRVYLNKNFRLCYEIY